MIHFDRKPQTVHEVNYDPSYLEFFIYESFHIFFLFDDNEKTLIYPVDSSVHC